MTFSCAENAQEGFDNYAEHFKGKNIMSMFVLGCNIGYTSCKEKQLLFRALSRMSKCNKNSHLSGCISLTRFASALIFCS